MALNTNPNAPRQKMINLMYLVLMALLALNVSSDVLNGFSLVNDSLSRSTANSTLQNQSLYESLNEAHQHNPEKIGPWLQKAISAKLMSDSLYAYLDELKWSIVRQADGKDGDVDNIINKENLEAATYIMLSPTSGQGKELFKRVNHYRENILTLVTDTLQHKIIRDNLSTAVPRRATAGKNWQEFIFENTPVAAAITLLSKLQSDIRYAEGEVLHTLTQSTDIEDVRVNQLKAYVIPTSQNVVRGNTYSARIILAAVDSTQRPSIYISGEKQPDDPEGLFETVCNRTGDFSLDGYLELGNNGNTIRREFSQKYTVVEPSATVSATLMNVLYAGYDNPISISVPGIPAGQVQASIINGNGTLKRVANGYVAHPTTIGKDAVIRVTTTTDGRTQSMGDYTYRVRQLPNPSPFIEYIENGTPKRYRGGHGLAKSVLLNTPGIVAAIDDGLLNINFRVLSFETVFFDNMGNAVPEVSAGASFSTRQKDMFRRLSRGKRFYISRVRAIGPDGVERLLPSTLEVIVN